MNSIVFLPNALLLLCMASAAAACFGLMLEEIGRSLSYALPVPKVMRRLREPMAPGSRLSANEPSARVTALAPASLPRAPTTWGIARSRKEKKVMARYRPAPAPYAIPAG